MGINSDLLSQFNYYPSKPENISEADYRRGKLILENSYEQIRSAKNGIVAIDYLNIATAYSIMGQPFDTIYSFLHKAKMINERHFCEAVKGLHSQYGGIENTNFYKKLGHSYKNLIESCTSKDAKNEKIDPLAYAKEGRYDPELVVKMDRIFELDQKYRGTNYDAILQTPLDEQNMKDIAKIIEEYGYPGKSLVGLRYDFVACAVIQRSNNMEYWDKYLPLISNAVVSGELSDVNHLKMLLDRVYIDKIGAQIFGSKMGVPFADDQTILDIKSKYNIDLLKTETYVKAGGYNKELIEELDRINTLDQRYRSPYDSVMQNPIDRQTIKDIENIIEKYGYPGKSLVGEKYASIAWLVIQHSELIYQEKYLPLIHKAVNNNELSDAPLRMLLDRIYTQKIGKQIFGSQLGIDFADDQFINEVKKNYNLE